MTKAYYTYRIQIANQERVEVQKWNTQHQLLGEPSGSFGYRNQQDEITKKIQSTQQSHQTDTGTLRSLGETLFNTLFDDVLRQDFVNFYHQVIQDKQLLRIELDIDERVLPEIAAIPWEFLCLPASANLGNIWIGTDPNIAFARRRTQWIMAPSIQVEPGERLRIALAIANPTGSSDLGVVIYDKVQTALEKLAQEQSERIELLPIVNPATPEALDTILEKKPHIFHFVGHGRLLNKNQEEVGEIALIDDIFNEALWVDASFFSELLNRQRPSVVMLQACEGGMLSSSQAFVGVSSRIVQQNIPVVVAMQHQISNIWASRFAYRFYERLAQDYPVDIAVQDGRRAIALNTQYQKYDFATPVLFMQVQDGYLFKHEDTLAPMQVERSHSNAPSLATDYREKRNISKIGAYTEKGDINIEHQSL
jgi:hypothetical protein